MHFIDVPGGVGNKKKCQYTNRDGCNWWCHCTYACMSVCTHCSKCVCTCKCTSSSLQIWMVRGGVSASVIVYQCSLTCM